MFLKKIVSRISENPPYENINEDTMEISEKSFNESTETVADDNWSTTSTRGNTSTLEGSFVEQNEMTDIQRCNKKKRGNLLTDGDNGSVSRTFSDDEDRNTESEAKKANTVCNQIIEERLSRIRNSAAYNNLLVDGDNGSVSLTVFGDKDCNTETETKKANTDCNQLRQERLSRFMNSIADNNVNDAAVIKRDNTGIVPELSSISNCESQPSFLKDVPSIFTQTEDEGDKQRNNITMKMSSNYSSVGVSEHQEKNKSFPASVLSLVSHIAKHRKPACSEALYGALFVVGCSKVLPNHLSNKMNTKCILRKRAEANGLVEAHSFVTSDVEETLSATPSKHVILYPSYNRHSIVVTFQHDSSSDLFQVGRYKKRPIDFSVDDTSPLANARRGVSRFACRISVRRDENNEARIYAGAFNTSGVISVSGEGLTHNYCGKMDGFTTNGVLILKPDQIRPTTWREVSVSGYIYPVRSSKMDAPNRPRIHGESNVLIDGTLIDLCGVTLIWRTPEGLKKIPSEGHLSHLQSTLHKHAQRNSLLSRNSSLFVYQVERAVKKCFVHHVCGHVTGFAFSKPPDNCGRGWPCPICSAVGPAKELSVGIEPGFCFHEEVPSFAAFKPCGHVANQNTVDFWSYVEIPNHRKTQRSICPFCGQNLNFITKFVRLNLPIV